MLIVEVKYSFFKKSDYTTEDRTNELDDRVDEFM
jgi:hypothetical protein